MRSPDRLGGPHGNDATLTQEGDTVGDAKGQVAVMGHHQGGGVGHGIGTHDLPPNRHCNQRIQFTGGLVIQDHLRLHYQRPCDGHALLHAARQFRRILQGILRSQMHQRQFLLDDPLDLQRRFEAVFGQVKTDIFAHGQ